MRKIVIPECNAETVLAQVLFPDNIELIEHQEGCNEVTKQMKNYDFAIGIIDDDKRKPNYLENFSEINSANNVQLLKYDVGNKYHYMFILYKAVDTFILNAAISKGVNPENYGFPSDLKQFCRRTKSVAILYDSKFKEFLLEILDRKAPSFVTLQEWGSILINK